MQAPLTHDHLSAISGISPDGQLFLQKHQEAYDGAAIIAYLRSKIRKIPGKFLIIWDGASIHRRKLLKAWLARGAAQRLHWERLPGYAPELNPDEGIWQYVKEVELANVCCPNIPELQTELVRARERLRHKRDLTCGMFPRCGYYHLSFFVPSSIAARAATASADHGRELVPSGVAHKPEAGARSNDRPPQENAP